MLRFQEEVAFLRQAKWNVAKLLYVSARYMPVLMAPLLIASNQVFNVEDVNCQILGNLALVSSIITLFAAESIFLLRTCAMWLTKPYIRYVLLIFIVAVSITNLIIFLGQDKFISDVSACKSFGQPLLWAIILEFLVLELALIILTVLRCTKDRGSTLVEPLLVLLLRHNIFYYSCGFLLSIVNALCMWRLNVDYAYPRCLFTVQITMHTILATRMQYQLWEADRARRCYQSEQYPTSLLFVHPTDVIIAS